MQALKTIDYFQTIGPSRCFSQEEIQKIKEVCVEIKRLAAGFPKDFFKINLTSSPEPDILST